MLKRRYSFLILMCMILGLPFSAGCKRGDTASGHGEVDPEDSNKTTLPPIEIVVVDDEALATAIEREWSGSGGEPLAMKQIGADELTQRRNWTADVIIYPFSWMGHLVANRVIRPLERAADSSTGSSDDGGSLDADDFFERTRNSEMHFGKKVYAASLGSPQFVLLYRKDVLRKLSLPVPTTWTEYAQLVVSLQENATIVRDTLGTTEEQPMIGEPIGEGWAAKMFLARAAAYARNRSQYSCLFTIQSFEPQIDQVPFLRALDELRQIRGKSVDGTPYSIANEFAAGNLAVAITWPEAMRTGVSASGPGADDAGFPIGIASLPGSRAFFDRTSAKWQDRAAEESVNVPMVGVSGRCASIGRRVPDLDRAYDFIVWLTNGEIAIRTSSRSRDTTISRVSQCEQLRTTLPRSFTHVADEYAEVIKSDQTRDSVLGVIRVPGHDQYLASLDVAIRESFSTDESSLSVLRQVAKRWTEITEQIGRDKQIIAYGDSLGINPE